MLCKYIKCVTDGQEPVAAVSDKYFLHENMQLSCSHQPQVFILIYMQEVFICGGKSCGYLKPIDMYSRSLLMNTVVSSGLLGFLRCFSRSCADVVC